MSRDGYCMHGVYVGGVGIDWMCHMCELGAVYIIEGVPVFDLRVTDALDSSWMKFRAVESIKDPILDLWEEYPDKFTMNFYTESVWVTEEEAREAHEKWGYKVISPYEHVDEEWLT